MENKKVYDYHQVMNAIDTIKNFNITTTKKAEHKYKWYEFKKIIDTELYEINKSLYNEDMYAFSKYYELVEKLYNITNKKDMDHALNYLKESTINDLYKCLELA